MGHSSAHVQQLDVFFFFSTDGPILSGILHSCVEIADGINVKQFDPYKEGRIRFLKTKGYHKAARKNRNDPQ